MKATKRIHFTDNGQDFLTWEIDERGIITNSEPFQKSIWVGGEVINHLDIKAGSKVIYKTTIIPDEIQIKHTVEKIETL